MSKSLPENVGEKDRPLERTETQSSERVRSEILITSEVWIGSSCLGVDTDARPLLPLRVFLFCKVDCVAWDEIPKNHQNNCSLMFGNSYSL